MGAEPARLPRTAGKVPARAGLVAAGHHLHFMVDRAPGENAGRDVEDFVGGIGIEIGRGHGADAALAEAPRRGGIGLGDLLLHLHEGFERHLAAAEALRQQRAIEPVLDQRRGHRRRQAPRPLDLVGVARDQRLQRSRALDQVEAGRLVHALPRIVWFCLARGRDGGPSAATDQDGWSRSPHFTPWRARDRAKALAAASADGKLNATATAAMPMPKEPT